MITLRDTLIDTRNLPPIRSQGAAYKSKRTIGFWMILSALAAGMAVAIYGVLKHG